MPVCLPPAQVRALDVDSGMLDSLSEKLVPPSRLTQFGSNYLGPSDLPISPLFVRATSLPPRQPKTKIFDVEYEPETKPSRKHIICDDDVTAYKPYKPRVFSRTHRPKVVVYSEIFEPMYKSAVLNKNGPRYNVESDVIKPRRATSVYSLPRRTRRSYLDDVETDCIKPIRRTTSAFSLPPRPQSSYLDDLDLDEITPRRVTPVHSLAPIPPELREARPEPVPVRGDRADAYARGRVRVRGAAAPARLHPSLPRARRRTGMTRTRLGTCTCMFVCLFAA